MCVCAGERRIAREVSKPPGVEVPWSRASRPGEGTGGASAHREGTGEWGGATAVVRDGGGE